MRRGSDQRPAAIGVAAIVVYATIVLAPYVMAGPNDLEEFFTGVTGTRLAVQAISEGDWPFWSSDLGLGVPLPLKYHFTTHPLSALCLVDDCHRVLRVATALQIVIGAICLMLILRRTGARQGLATVGALAFLVTSSTIEDTYVNDWSSTALDEATIPILVYFVLRLVSAARQEERWLWTLAFGGTTGFLLSMGYPAPQLMVVGLFLLARPSTLWSHLRWFAIAAVVALLIGGGHLYHLAEQVALTPPTAVRSVHDEASPFVELWSTFARPIGGDVDRTWRIIFLGPPFAVLAVMALVRGRRDLWPYKFAVVASILLMVLPERALFDLVTARWFFRAGVNIFGIVLAVHLLESMLAAPTRPRAVVIVACIVVAQFAWQWWAFVPVWRAVGQVAIGGVEPDTNVRRLSRDRPAVDQLRSLYAARPGRLLIGERAWRGIRSLSYTNDGLAPNVFAIANVPTVSAFAHGIVLDALYPTAELTGGQIWPPASAQMDQAFLDILGIRYLLLLPGEVGPPGMEQRANVQGGLRLFENGTAWPEAFAVESFPTTPLPRVAGCAHDRFMCADFTGYDVHRTDTVVGVEPHRDGLTLHVPRSDREQRVVVTQWYRPGWAITPTTAVIAPAVEQLIGVTIPPGETSVRLTYFPTVRAVLFLIGIGSELVVGGLCVILAIRARRPD